MAKRTFSQALKSLFGLNKNKPGNDEFYENLTDILIEGDVGAKTAFEIVENLEEVCKKEKVTSQSGVTAELERLLFPLVKAAPLTARKGCVNIFVVLGVNGVGKTTTIAKLANIYKAAGENVIVAAADTFRAAAIEQLDYHAKRVGVRIVKHQSGSDPAAVVFDAGTACRAAGGGIVLADTAGRLHNKENLVEELKKIDRICVQKAGPVLVEGGDAPDAEGESCCKRILVLDATTGQNAFRQAEVFKDAVGVDSIVLTKYDSSARGGILFSIGRELGIPVCYVCTGEHYGDIEEFDAQKYIKEFLGDV